MTNIDIKRLVKLQKELTILYKQGVISVWDEGVQISGELWAIISQGKKIYVSAHGGNYPIETFFYKHSVKFYKIWTLEEYLKEEK